MLTCFNLQPNASLEDFQQALDSFSRHMQAEDLLTSVGTVGRRCKHEIMDTDDERDHEFFFITSFRDRAHCDRAVGYIMPGENPGDSSHRNVYMMIQDPVFICWEDT